MSLSTCTDAQHLYGLVEPTPRPGLILSGSPAATLLRLPEMPVPAGGSRCWTKPERWRAAMGFPSASGFWGGRDAGPVMTLDGVRGRDPRRENLDFQIFPSSSAVRKGPVSDPGHVAAELRRPTHSWEGETGMNPEPVSHGGLRGMGSETRCCASSWEPGGSLGMILR